MKKQACESCGIGTFDLKVKNVVKHLAPRKSIVIPDVTYMICNHCKNQKFSEETAKRLHAIVYEEIQKFLNEKLDNPHQKT